MEDRYHGEVDGLSEQLRVCESILEEEKRQHTVAKQEIARLNQELEVSRDDWHQEKATMFEQVKVSLSLQSVVCMREGRGGGRERRKGREGERGREREIVIIIHAHV